MMRCAFARRGLCELHGLTIPDGACLACPDIPADVVPAASRVVAEVPPISQERQAVCVHRGSQRRCCNSLWICRKHRANCTRGASHNDEVLSCASCDDWEPVQRWAPLPGGALSGKGWEGPFGRKPWQYPVTVAIPVCNASEACGVILQLLRLQTERPFVVLIDTGSTSQELASLEELRADDCEVHSLRLNGVQHPSDFPAMAMDLAFAICRSPYLLATHADVFFRSRGVVGELLGLCQAGNPVVGYEITERPHSDWPGMFGHTLTMFDVSVMDRIGGGWSLRRLLANFQHPDGHSVDRGISSATAPNWPDTELLLNYQCRRAGIVPLIIGTERNAARTVDDRIDHCRSWASAQLYASGGQYAADVGAWLVDGIAQARERVRSWSGVDHEID